MDQANQYKYGDATITLYYDEDAEDPRCQDNLGVMLCKHPRHNLGDEQIDCDYDSWEDVIESMKEERGAMVVLPLYLHEHGSLTMNVGGFGDPWDSGQVGWICDTDEARKLFGLENDLARKITEAESVEAAITALDEFRDHIKTMLQNEVEIYDHWLRGDMYGYIVTDDDDNEYGSCWGFYGEEEALEAARDEAEQANAHLKELRIQAFVDEVEASATLASAP